MAHVRTQIRDAIAALLFDNTTAGQNVVVGRVHDVDMRALEVAPHISVFTSEDQVDSGQDVVIGADGSIRQIRILSVEIQTRAIDNGVNDYDTVLDDVCAEIESILSGNLTLGGLCKWLIYSSVQKEATAEKERPQGVAQQTFSAEYRVDQRDPATPLE